MSSNLHVTCLIALFVGAHYPTTAAAEDWGLYAISPASAPKMVLEAVVSAGADGEPISINAPSASAGQKWSILKGEDGFFSIRTAADPSMVLGVSQGSAKQGALIVLEKDRAAASQLWSLVRRDGGAYSLTPKHAPAMGVDLFGGRQEPGSKVDLWSLNPGDRHLHWFITPLAGSGVATQESQNGNTHPAYEPPAIRNEEILSGTLKQFNFEKSMLFPGTTREVTVFIPAQYDGSKPACVYVKTDGFNPREKTLMETMIATKEMPVTVGVFVRPGELRAPMAGTAGRRNRDLEYDGVNDNHVRFLTDELLPFIAKEFNLRLSTDGNDRCMAGGSSGGIAAFTAAWMRPDAFSRVYAASGSWVAFRGGHEFPTMVRKFEAKPIRAFLTTATHDMENCAGDWYLLDQEMDKAMKFSGYDYQFRTIEGRHVAGYGEHWREAMAYLWREWPARVKAGPSSPRAQEIILPGEGWELLASGFKSTRGPSCDSRGEVFFADTTNNKIHKIGLDGSITEFASNTGNAHCLSVGANGTVYSVSEKSGKIMSYGADGKGALVTDGLPAHSILAMPNGDLYVTSNDDTKPKNGGSVWLVKGGNKTCVDSGVKFATGLTYRPDQWLISVAEGHSKWIYSYQIASDGALINKERFFHLHVADCDDDAGAESICYSVEGRQFIATRSGVQVSADDGPTQVILPVPDGTRVSAVAIGGKDGDTLFAFCMDKIWKRKIQQHSMGAFTPWTKVAPNKL